MSTAQFDIPTVRPSDQTLNTWLLSKQNSHRPGELRSVFHDYVYDLHAIDEAVFL